MRCSLRLNAGTDGNRRGSAHDTPGCGRFKEGRVLGGGAVGYNVIVPIDVAIEKGSKRVFASALDWPGWARAGRDEATALEALEAYRARYADVVRAAGIRFGTGSSFVVAERLKGDATTDFGAPGIPPASDSRSLTPRQLPRLRGILEATWSVFDAAIDDARGKALAKGPRGGGRELQAIVEHVNGALGGYLRRIAAKPEGEGREAVRAAALEALQRAVTEGLPASGPRGGTIWSPRYFIRREAWHVLDHAWEIEDRAVR